MLEVGITGDRSWKLASSHLGTHTRNSLVIVVVLNKVPFALVKYELSHLMLIENAIVCHLVSSVNTIILFDSLGMMHPVAVEAYFWLHLLLEGKN